MKQDECDNLYKSLSYNISKEDITTMEKEIIIKKISELSINKKEIVYYLILHDFLINNKNSKVVYPYKCKQVGNNIEINIDNLPNILKQIIYKFVKILDSE